MKSQLSQLQKKQTLLKIFIFTLVTVFVWVGLSLFRTQQQTGIKPELIDKSEALNPNINTEVIDQIEQKRAFSDLELADFPIYSIVTTKSGEQQLVVFSAADKSRRTVVIDSNASQPPANSDTPVETPANQGTPTQGGGTVTVERASPQPFTGDQLTPEGTIPFAPPATTDFPPPTESAQ